MYEKTSGTLDAVAENPVAGKENFFELQNVGPIPELKIPLPVEGGVVLVLGENGTGKSTAIEAVSGYLSGNDKTVSLKDGEKSGFIRSTFGPTIVLGGGRRKNGSAEAIIDHIEGKYPISDLVDPPIKNPKSADALRIKCLLKAFGVGVTKDAFEALFVNTGIDFGIVSPSSCEGSDPVEMSRRIKADVEAEARRHEELAEKYQSEYEMSIDGTEYEESDIIDDLGAFNATSGTLSAKYHTLIEQAKAFKSAQKTIDDAKKAIRSIDIEAEEERIQQEEAILKGKSLHREQMIMDMSNLDTEITSIEALLRDAKDRKKQLALELANNETEINAAESTIKEIKEKLNGLSGYEIIIREQEELLPISDEEIAAAKDAFDIHNSRLVKHSEAVSNKKRRDKAESKRVLMIEEDQKGKTLRQIASGCENVLTDLINAPNDDGDDQPLLFVENERLIVNTGRGKTYYSDLSDGERWRAAIRAVAHVVNKRTGNFALLTIPQRGWEALDPKNRKLIDSLAKEYGVCVFGGRCTNGGLHAKIYDPAEDEVAI